MFEKILEQIIKHDTITIFGHINPDGDCFGAQIGLRDSLRLTFPDKTVNAVGSGVPAFFSKLGSLDQVDDVTIAKSLAILVDGNDFSRMEDQRINKALSWVKIDHHVDNGTFSEGFFVVKEEANSTCELIADFILEAKLKINNIVADALFLGIVTDTGRFQYITDFPRAFRQVAWLCEQGADPNGLNRILNITEEKSLGFKGFVFSHYQKTNDGVIYLLISKEQLATYHLSASKAGSMVNLIGNIKGFPIWAFFVENEDGTNHVEFRSNGPAVQPIALKYGGGGHALAAGVTLTNSESKLINQVIADLNQSIRDFNKENQ
ncbi:MAG: bifunctional oligoribonuclease/PAP phosphatase NrnA [Bacilli bacterium]|jgi:phosphoesterase RecJ-like protein|nr:bifunctional oligoribonuclease/PAP phosphatase NrnA [Bacilli bacterium]MDD3068814.1 bifunctional oligoribonuclease/PAP phosphatase NrnA [Bacilli bacterium]MDD3841202.1 bifunctional oligoribonuclease/PAP phosphatase NrnA [Bacilli bacterium]HKM10071.1 bifunctional oligoribonuclease/PAP phosphatase NrnA [Bacilli bacterium]